MSKAAGLFVSGALGCMTAMAWGGWGSAPPTPPASPPLRTAREEPGAADAGKGPQVPAVQSSVVGVPIYRIEDPKEMLKYGFPGPVTDVASRMGYISAWDRRTRNPAWVLEKLTPDTVRPRNGSEGGVKVQRRNVFTEDPSIPEMFRTRLSDFYRSGYDRGHMVPSADCKGSQLENDETFMLSNMSPQVGHFNSGYWALFESFCRDTLAMKYDSVRIYTGPLWLPKRVGDKTIMQYEVIGSPPVVAVPTHYFKVLICESRDDPVPHVGTFVMPNEPIDLKTPLRGFELPLDAVERTSGLTFSGPSMPRHKRLCDQIACQFTADKVREFQKFLDKRK